MPAQVLQMAHEREDADHCFFLTEIDTERLRTAPAFDEDKWPDLRSTAWAKPIDEFYARDMRWRDEVRPEPASTGGTASYCVKATKVRGLNLKTMGGEGAGEIEEVVFDPALARVAYVVLSTGGFLGLGEKHFALPWQALAFTPEGDDIQCRLGIPESKLEKAPEFKGDDWKRMSDRVWLKEIYTYYGYPIYWTDEPPRNG
jgi:PRC-barrel domain protein